MGEGGGRGCKNYSPPRLRLIKYIKSNQITNFETYRVSWILRESWIIGLKISLLPT